MIRKKMLAPVAFVTLVVSASVATAQDGYIGLTFGNYTVKNPENGNYNGRNTMVDGLFRWNLGSGAVVIEGSRGSDSINPSALYGTEMTTQKHFALHSVHKVGSAATISGFYGRGAAPHDSAFDDYALVYGGIGASYAASPTFTVYGQLGMGDAPNDATTDSFGFSGGEFGRIGVSYTGLANTAISMEWERGFSESYEDSDEPGSFGSLFLGGVTAIPAAPEFQVTYGIRNSFFDARNDSDRLSETSASLGFRYVIGGKAPGDYVREGVLGSPHVPLRASNWTPALD
ncbi:MAG: hypothetical protein MUE83_13755 [Tabrizicola sp.]|jgi:hypothetical protein|nr:hypothetical protein [Tabrizicola sp.]